MAALLSSSLVSVCVLLLGASLVEHGEQRHMQRPPHHGVKALLQSGPLQQADDQRPAHLSAGYNHREQDCCPHWHLNWTSAAGTQQPENYIHLTKINSYFV